jgi:hypothetical protein
MMEHWINGKKKEQTHYSGIPLTHSSILKKGRGFPRPLSHSTVIASEAKQSRGIASSSR